MRVKKNLLTSLLVVVLCAFCLAFGVTKFEPKQTRAEEGSLPKSEFVITNGAFIRLPNEDEISGIKFSAYITSTYYDTLKAENDGLTLTLKSTISKEVGDGENAPNPFVYEWDITDEISFDQDGKATFFHTLNFSGLSGENLKKANAFEMTADFFIEVEGKAEKILADNYDTADTTRSMRQVAFTAYNTVGSEGYKNEALKTYFTQEDSTSVLQDMDDKDTLISSYAPSGVSIDKAYLLNGTKAVDVTGKTLAGENGALTAEDASEGITRTLVFFDSDNVAYPVELRLVTKLLANEEDLKYLMATTAPYTNGLTSSIYAFNEITAGDKVSRKGYYLMTADITFNGQPWSGTGNPRYFENGTFDGNGHTLDATITIGWSYGLFGNTYNVTIKDTNIKIHAINNKFTGNQNQAAVLGACMRNSIITNCNITIDSANTTAIEKLYLTTEWASGRAVMINVPIYVADGILAETATTYGVAGNWTIDGVFYASTNCYIFANTTLTGANHSTYTSVASAIENGVSFKPFTDSGNWVLLNNQLVWKATIKNNVDVSINDVATESVTLGFGETATVTGSNSTLGTLIPTLTIVEGNDIVSIEDNEITALSVAGTATITATYDLAGETVEKQITVTVKDLSAEPEVFTGGNIMLSDVNDKAHLPAGLTPITVKDEEGVVYYSNGAWDWSKISAPLTYEFTTLTLYVETEEVTYIVDAEIYMGVIASEEDFKYFAARTSTYLIDSLLVTATRYTSEKARTGYWIFADDVTVNTSTWSDLGMGGHRYYDNLTLDGNGHTLSIKMDTGWMFGLFGRSYELLVKNLHLDISLTNEKLTSNTNTQIIISDDLRNSMINNCLIDISAADTIVTPVSTLYLTTGNNANICFNNCVTNIADGILAENAVIKQMAGNWSVHGTTYNTNNSIFVTSVSGVTANNSCVVGTVSELPNKTASRYDYNALIGSDWWTYDEDTQTLTWGLKNA